jgi:hypothetical protein
MYCWNASQILYGVPLFMLRIHQQTVNDGKKVYLFLLGKLQIIKELKFEEKMS